MLKHERGGPPSLVGAILPRAEIFTANLGPIDGVANVSVGLVKDLSTKTGRVYAFQVDPKLPTGSCSINALHSGIERVARLSANTSGIKLTIDSDGVYPGLVPGSIGKRAA